MSSLKNNLSLKIAAVLIAILAWYVVMEDKNPVQSQDFHIPVTVLGTEVLSDHGLTVTSVINPMVNVKLKGNRNDIRHVDMGQIRASIDLSESLEEGSQTYRVKIDKPNAVNIASIEPEYIEAKLENVIKKSIPVTVKIMDQLPDKFVLGDVSSTPANIVVQGPASKVAEVVKVEAPVYVKDLKKNSTQNVQIYVLNGKDQTVQGISVKQEFVNIHVEVKNVKTLPVEVVTSGKTQDGVTILNTNVSPKTVNVIGSEEELKKLDKIVTAPVDLSTILDDTKVSLKLKIPDGVELYDKKDLVYANFLVEKTIEKTILIPPTSIVLDSISSNLRSEINDSGFIEVTLRGKNSVIDHWTSKNVIVRADVSGLSTGVHSVSLKGEVIKGVEILRISPEKMDVRLY